MMTRRYVLAALARGLAAGDDAVARAALARTDLVLRGAARRTLGRALIEAELAATEAGLHAPPPPHVMRLAALAVAGRELPPAGDEAAVAAAYAALPAAAVPRVPVATLVVCVALVGVLGAFGYALVTHHAPPRTYTRVLPAPSADAYRVGGVPLHDPAIDALLDAPLTDLVVKGGQARDQNDHAFPSQLAAMRGKELGHGKALGEAWQHVIDAFGTAVDAAKPPTRRDEIDLREAVRALTDQLAAAGLGYFLEGRFKNGYPMIQSYRVEEIRFVVTNGAPRRVLSLGRIDHLNTAYAVLGMDNEDIGDPVLHLARIAEYVASTELPVLDADAVYPLAEQTFLDTPEGRALGSAAGAAVRAEYMAALGADAPAAQKIAHLLAERGGIIEQWRDHLGRKQVVFSDTDDLFVPPALLEALNGQVPHYQIERVRAIDDSLATLEAPRIHARMLELVANTVRRHEAQHGFDFDRATQARYPDLLRAFLGPEVDENGDPVAIVDAARAELSAYLSQVINDPVTPHAAFWHLAQEVFTKSRAGTGEDFAGIVAIIAIAKQAGADVSGHWFPIERLTKLALVIAKLDDAALRAKTAAAWQDLYGEPPTTIADVPDWY